jgi:hypothetical protein
MKWVTDATGRFPERPHYTTDEIDAECETVLRSYSSGLPSFPLSTNDLVILLESQCADLDLYADLAAEGAGIEGVTLFDPRGGKPTVRIEAAIASDKRRENRLRTTLTHELGHVRLHSFLFPLNAGNAGPRCDAANIVRPPARDWMEWQAAYASGAFLMPRAAISDVVQRLSGSREPALVRTVQSAFAVSAEAARIRLLQLGFVSQSNRIAGVSRRPGWYLPAGKRVRSRF